MEIKRALLRWGWIAGWSELTRSQRISAEDKLALTTLAGLAIGPFVVVLFGGSLVWWLLTGKRLPGPLGRWIGPPSRLSMNAYPKKFAQMPPDMRAALKRKDETQKRAHAKAVRELGRKPTPEEVVDYFRREKEQPPEVGLI